MSNSRTNVAPYVDRGGTTAAKFRFLRPCSDHTLAHAKRTLWMRAMRLDRIPHYKQALRLFDRWLIFGWDRVETCARLIEKWQRGESPILGYRERNMGKVNMSPIRGEGVGEESVIPAIPEVFVELTRAATGRRSSMEADIEWVAENLLLAITKPEEIEEDSVPSRQAVAMLSWARLAKTEFYRTFYVKLVAKRLTASRNPGDEPPDEEDDEGDDQELAKALKALK